MPLCHLPHGVESLVRVSEHLQAGVLQDLGVQGLAALPSFRSRRQTAARVYARKFLSPSPSQPTSPSSPGHSVAVGLTALRSSQVGL